MRAFALRLDATGAGKSSSRSHDHPAECSQQIILPSLGSEVNHGTDAEVKYVSCAGVYTLVLTPGDEVPADRAAVSQRPREKYNEHRCRHLRSSVLRHI